MTRKEAHKLLTEAELELMRVLWAGGPATVREVMGCLPEGRTPAYTTVSTVLRILESKGFVESEKVGRSHRYAAVEAKAGYETRKLSHILSGLFEGSPLSLMRRLVSSQPISTEELREMQRLLDEHLGDDT